MSKSETFKAWMERIASDHEARVGNVWDTWPKAAKGEIDRVIAHNDQGNTPRISMRLLLERLKDQYDIETNNATIARYCQKELSRSGWKK